MNKLLNLSICVVTCTLLLVYYNHKIILGGSSTEKQDESIARSGRTNIKEEDAASKPPFAEVPIEELLKGPYILPQDNPQLIENIQNKLSPPSKEPYHLANTNVNDQSRGQSQEIRNILGEMRNGFFIECGTWDGEMQSNTLMFEKEYGWNGLLVEASPGNYHMLMSKQRKAWTIHACLSIVPYPNTVLFPVIPGCCGIISDSDVSSKLNGHTEVQCLPLFSILMALNTTTIDFFSLDIEGHELDVLKTIPWERVNIRTLTVEHKHIPGGKTALCQYMESVGYYIYKSLNPLQDAKEKDTIFYKKDIIPKIPSL